MAIQLFIIKNKISKTNFHKKYNISNKEQILYITVGSRDREIDTLSKIYIEALKKLESQSITPRLIIATLKDKEAKIKKIFKGVSNKTLITSDTEEKEYFLKKSNFALAKSGTNNFEIAKANIAFIICYKVNLMTYILLKIMVRTKYVNLINIFAKKEIITELIQYKCNSNNIAKSLKHYLENPKAIEKQIRQQKEYLSNFLNKNQNPNIVAAKEIEKLLS